MFFSEEKNRKTFISPLPQNSGMTDILGAAGSKSFLLLFFQKRRLSSFLTRPKSSSERQHKCPTADKAC
jgi:hypothetical protein